MVCTCRAFLRRVCATFHEDADFDDIRTPVCLDGTSRQKMPDWLALPWLGMSRDNNAGLSDHRRSPNFWGQSNGLVWDGARGHVGLFSGKDPQRDELIATSYPSLWSNCKVSG